MRNCRFIKWKFLTIVIIGLVRIHSGAQSFSDAQICAGESIVITHSESAQWQARYDNDVTPDSWTVFQPNQDGCTGLLIECGPTLVYDDGCEICQFTPSAPDWRTFAFSGTSVTFVSRLGRGPATVKFRFKEPGSPDWTLVSETLEILGVPPSLDNVPPATFGTVSSVAEANYTSPTLDIQHVKCFGESSGLIVVKALSGSGLYRFTLTNSFGQPYNITSSTLPVVLNDQFLFPDVPITGLKADLYSLKIESLPSGCFNTYSIRIKEPALDLSAPHSLTERNGFNVSCHDIASCRLP